MMIIFVLVLSFLFFDNRGFDDRGAQNKCKVRYTKLLNKIKSEKNVRFSYYK